MFEQIPHSHIQGHGCPTCNSLTTEKFIKRSNKIHSNYYSYDNTNIVDIKTKVIIKCNIHGNFEQRPDAHMRGQGCSKCFRKRKVFTTEKFIEKSNLIHNNIYDYSLVQYKSNKHKVKIICKKHKIFEQTPQHHLNGVGCPICNRSKGEKKIEKYFIDNKIFYNSQKTFESCKYKALLRFDFYLPEFNICIEYNGIQHYTPIEFFGGVNEYNIRNERFNIKKKFCKDNNIKLIVIKYDEDVDRKLKNSI